MEERTADIVVFSDGSHPDPRDDKSCQDLPRAGWVACIKGKSPMEDQVLYSSWVVTPSMVARWSERETQIVMVEMIGCLLAIDYLALRFPGLYYTFLIDSEPVEGALVKGSSGHSDITSGAGIFWDLCLRYDLKAYLSRISSESNPGDAPSQADFMFLQEAGAEWVDLKPSPEVLDFAKWDEIVDDRLLES